MEISTEKKTINIIKPVNIATIYHLKAKLICKSDKKYKHNIKF